MEKRLLQIWFSHHGASLKENLIGTIWHYRIFDFRFLIVSEIDDIISSRKGKHFMVLNDDGSISDWFEDEFFDQKNVIRIN